MGVVTRDADEWALDVWLVELDLAVGPGRCSRIDRERSNFHEITAGSKRMQRLIENKLTITTQPEISLSAACARRAERVILRRVASESMASSRPLSSVMFT